jgi:aspartyl aminopeptidase
MNDRNWEEIYEAILKDIVYVMEGNREDYEKVERVTSILVSNDFMEKPPLYS